MQNTALTLLEIARSHGFTASTIGGSVMVTDNDGMIITSSKRALLLWLGY